MKHRTSTSDSLPAGTGPVAASATPSRRRSKARAKARAHSPAKTSPAKATRNPSPGDAPSPAASGPPEPAPLDPPDFGFAPPEVYDPADYRWVPVKRKARRDGWTEEKQRRFIEVLADTGLVSMAAKDVGMTRTAAYKLRRAPHAAAFARAWDLARERAGAVIEDVAFERALEGVETEVYDRHGGLTGSKTIYNDRLLTFLLRHLKPERYGTATHMRMRAAAGYEPAQDASAAAAALSHPAREQHQSALPEACADTAPRTMDSALRAMEPVPPAPGATLVDDDDLYTELLVAEIADGTLRQFLSEQTPAKSPEDQRAAAMAARYERGRQICERGDFDPLSLSEEEYADWCLYLDPASASEYPRKFRPEHRRRPPREL